MFRLDNDLLFPFVEGFLFDEERDFFFFVTERLLGEEAPYSLSNAALSLFRPERGVDFFPVRPAPDFDFEDDVLRFEFGKTPPYLLLNYTTKVLT